LILQALDICKLTGSEVMEKIRQIAVIFSLFVKMETLIQIIHKFLKYFNGYVSVVEIFFIFEEGKTKHR
jgi:hypothetical protein